MSQSSSNDVEDEEEDLREHGYEDFGDYWLIKQEKLRKQTAPLELKSAIFSGVCIWVNGRTNPTQSELRDLVCAHGGRHEYVLSRSLVTHIIATVLPTGKINQLSGKVVVVRPEWIVDSISAGMLLDVDSYRLYSPNTSKQLHNQSIPKTTDPEFLTSYYKSSRLHHLSTWREELKSFADDLMRKRKINKPALQNQDPYILHVDMDCFFASVSLIDRPDLHERPVVIAHTSNPNAQSSSEVSSCNYPARSFGIKNGMRLGKAFELCKDLVVLPYDFEKYNQVARAFYTVLSEFAFELKPVSCDEAYLKVYCDNANEFCIGLKQEIFTKCQCNASIGASVNLLLARLATRFAKPDGVFVIPNADSVDFAQINVDALPGVGWSTRDNLEAIFKVKTCADLQRVPMDQLTKQFGPNLGKSLWQKCRGIDGQNTTSSFTEKSARKSVGTEVTWGVRVETEEEAKTFLRNLCDQVIDRLEALGCESEDGNHPLQAQKITLKVMLAREDAPAPRKHLGHGICDSFTKSKTGVLVDTREQLYSDASSMLKAVLKDSQYGRLRGVGLFLGDLRRKPTRTIESYLSVRPDQSTMTLGEDERLRRLGIDPVVFNELPIDVQRDIIAEHTMVSAPQTPPKQPTLVNDRRKRQKTHNHHILSPSQLTLTQLWRGDKADAEHASLVLSLRNDTLEDDDFVEHEPKSPSKSSQQQQHVDLWGAQDLINVLPCKYNGRVVGLEDVQAYITDHSNDGSKKEDKLQLEDFMLGLVDMDCLEPLSELLKVLKEISGYENMIKRVLAAYNLKYQLHIRFNDLR